VKVAIFSAKKYDREFLNAANGSRHELRFFEPHLNEETAGLAGVRRRQSAARKAGRLIPIIYWFCFARIAWQFAPHTRDGCCFLEGFCKCT
jgi:hypothetical protein